MTDDSATPGLLPDGSILVHIGMHKTGTTAIQSLLAEHRDELAARGIVYPGHNDAHHLEARSLIQLAVGAGAADPAPSPERWARCVDGLAREPGRAVLSSEFFSVAGDQAAQRLVAELGADRVHILVGVRNPAATAVSTWQQQLKQGRVSGIEQWAASNIPRDGTLPKDPRYWQQADLEAVTRRWVRAAGAQRVTVVVVDGADRERLPATFEHLLGLEPRFLSGRKPTQSNRGMTSAEAEFVRRVNVAVRGRLAWPAYRRLVRAGVIQTMVETRTPAPEEPRPVLPGWAQESARRLGEQAAAQIRALGVQVVGDLDALAARLDTGSAQSGWTAEVPTDSAVRAVVGAILADPDVADVPGARDPRVSDARTRELAGVIVHRMRRRALRSTRALGLRGH